MGRFKRQYDRPEDKKGSRLIIIATEGRQTERIYFEALIAKYNLTSIHVVVLPKLDSNSNPESVYLQLQEFEEKFILTDDDELWMIIDRDFQSWKPKEIKKVAQLCSQKKLFKLGLSNPSFEIWLLCHLVDVSKLNASKKTYLFNNKKVNSSKTACEFELSQILRGFNKTKYNPKIFIDKVEIGIENAEKCDINRKTRWPYYIGTSVYL